MKPIANTGCFALTRWIVLVALIGIFHGSDGVEAQDDFGADLFPNFSLGDFGEAKDDEPVHWAARYHVDADGTGRVEVEAALSPTWHIYSTTQKPGGPTPTTFRIAKPATAKLTGEFSPDHEPTKSVSSIYDGLTVEEHEGTVVWSAPITVPPGFDQPDHRRGQRFGLQVGRRQPLPACAGRAGSHLCSTGRQRFAGGLAIGRGTDIRSSTRRRRSRGVKAFGKPRGWETIS